MIFLPYLYLKAKVITLLFTVYSAYRAIIASRLLSLMTVLTMRLSLMTNSLRRFLHFLGLTAVYSVLKGNISDATKLYLIGEFDKVLSLDLTKAQENKSENPVNEEVESLIAQRTEARKNKDWATADAIRDKLKEMKVVVEDTKDGIKWHFEN